MYISSKNADVTCLKGSWYKCWSGGVVSLDNILTMYFHSVSKRGGQAKRCLPTRNLFFHNFPSPNSFGGERSVKAQYFASLC
jgi:hypothetical protein